MLNGTIVQGKEYTLIREDDLIGILPRPDATAADVPELKPLGDRVLLKVRRVLMHCFLSRHSVVAHRPVQKRPSPSAPRAAEGKQRTASKCCPEFSMATSLG